MAATFTKDPLAVLDYTIDWTAWLGVDTIPTSTWTIAPGITGTKDSHTTTATTIWLSGGVHGTDYKVSNRIVTAATRADSRQLLIKVRRE